VMTSPTDPPEKGASVISVTVMLLLRASAG
jgi:hypothetical protein